MMREEKDPDCAQEQDTSFWNACLACYLKIFCCTAIDEAQEEELIIVEQHESEQKK